MKNIGLLGLGTVGSGIIEILEIRKEEIKNLTGHDIRIKKVLVRDLNKKRDITLEPDLLTTNYDEILSDEEIDIIVEVTGDLEMSYKYISDALTRRKHVVTANKAVVSKYFEKLSSLAADNKVAFLYEASVGGGIPVLKPLKDALFLNEITEVQGILNGTCNYILTRMIDEGRNYEAVLRNAQKLGYAEADPTADIEGHDTLRKLRILATLAFQGQIREEDILLNGISTITSYDIDYIKNMNSTVKLIGEAKIVEDGFTAVVQPTIIKNSNYFANVNMAYNSVAFKGNNVGELKFYGAGAGKLPTANAVLSDVLDIIMGTYRKGNPLGQRVLKNLNSKIRGKYYLRVSDCNAEIIRTLKRIAEITMSVGSITTIITEEVQLTGLGRLIDDLNIGNDRYFFARILNY